MITYVEDAEKGIAEITLDGKITREALDEIIAKLGPLMEAHGKVGILKNIVSFGGIAPSALWEDLKFGFRHLKDVGPVAVVSDKKWIEIWTRLASPFFASETRFFDEAHLESARKWLESATAEMKSHIDS